MSQPPLTPEQIVGYHFDRAVRGYAIADVDAVLDRLADQVEAVRAELDGATTRIATLEDEVTEARSDAATARAAEGELERALREARETAERAVADARAAVADLVTDAEADAATIRGDAEVDAAGIRADAERDATQVREAGEDAARREVEGVRSVVLDAVAEHRELMGVVEANRDALRGFLARFDALVLTSPPVPFDTERVTEEPVGDTAEHVEEENPDTVTEAAGDAAGTVSPRGSDAPPSPDEGGPRPVTPSAETRAGELVERRRQAATGRGNRG